MDLMLRRACRGETAVECIYVSCFLECHRDPSCRVCFEPFTICRCEPLRLRAVLHPSHVEHLSGTRWHQRCLQFQISRPLGKGPLETLWSCSRALACSR